MMQCEQTRKEIRDRLLDVAQWGVINGARLAFEYVQQNPLKVLGTVVGATMAIRSMKKKANA